MKKKRKWLSWALVITGVIVAVALILAVNSEPLVRWFQDGSSGAGREREPATWQDALGKALISVFILALVMIHVGLVFAAANALNKPRVPIVRKPTTCVRCDRSVRRDWRVCPYCGWVLDKPVERAPMSPGTVPRM